MEHAVANEYRKLTKRAVSDETLPVSRLSDAEERKLTSARQDQRVDTNLGSVSEIAREKARRGT